jgi:hypothetical protein
MASSLLIIDFRLTCKVAGGLHAVHSHFWPCGHVPVPVSATETKSPRLHSQHGDIDYMA